MKRCSRCKTQKPLGDFGRHSRAKDGLQSYCKPCAVEYVREWEAANAERLAARHAQNLAETVPRDRTKLCRGCGQDKPLLEFYAHRGTRDRRTTYCKDCCRAYKSARNQGPAREDYLAYLKAWRENNPDRYHSAIRKWRLELYGLTLEAYEAMLADQGGACAICKGTGEGTSRPLGVDHCHETNRVRGLLCNGCNSVLGFARDSEETLLAAIDYLRRSRAVT